MRRLIRSQSVAVDGRCEKSLVIREGQIAGLDPPAICLLAELIPPHGMGLPGSYTTTPPSTLLPSP